MAAEEKGADGPLERTLALIKPDAVAAGKALEIRNRIWNAGFRIAVIRKEQLTKEKAELFYEEHKERSFFADLVTFMTSGPIFMLKLVKANAIADWRALMGPTNSVDARASAPDSIRAVYGTDVQQNACHGSDSPASAERELGIMFADLATLRVGFLSPRAYMEGAFEAMKDVYSQVVRLNIPGTPLFYKENDDAGNPIRVCDPGVTSDEYKEGKPVVEYYSDEALTTAFETMIKDKVDVVAGYSQKDAYHHIYFNKQLGHNVPGGMAFLYCMNKYLMRVIETRTQGKENVFWYDCIFPGTEDFAAMAAKITEYPFMLKNTSLSLGRGIFSIADEKVLKQRTDEYIEAKYLQRMIEADMEAFKKYIPDDQKAEIPELPPFITEHKVDIFTTIEYCYEGFITPEGEIVDYALTEEVYFRNHQALGYLTPPMNLDRAKTEKIQEWVNRYMTGFSELGYRNQFFNLELWLTDGGDVLLTEINPRAAHSFHYNYLYSFGTTLFEDNMELARGANMDAIKDINPWTLWNYGDGTGYKYTLIVLFTSKQTGKVSEIFNFDEVDKLEAAGILVRYNRQREDVLTEKDMTSAGCMVMQIWITGNSAKEMVAKEIEMRKNLYREPQTADYPEYWDPEKL